MTTYTRSDDFARTNGVSETQVILGLRDGALKGKQVGANWFVEAWQRMDSADDGPSTVRPKVACRQCGGAMQEQTRHQGAGVQVLTALALLAGISLAFSGGLLVGIFLAVGAMVVAGRSRRLWVCQQCGYFFDRT